MEVKPYSESSDSKKTQVAMMFNNIAHRYDFLNHLLSMGVDKIWRRRAIRLLKDLKSPRVLDIATGTGDLAILFANTLQFVNIMLYFMCTVVFSVLKRNLKQHNADYVVSRGD